MTKSSSQRRPAGGQDLDTRLLREMRQAVPADVIASLIETEEIADDDFELASLLQRFLRAEKLDVGRAARRLARHAAWRREHLPRGTISEADVQGQIAQEKVLLQPSSPEGSSPLLVIRVSRHRPVTDHAEVERFVVFCLEAASRLCDHPGNPDGKLWALFDLEKVKWANLDAAALKACFSVLNAAFPERVRCIYMLNSPLIFDGLWRIVSPFIDPVTRAKVQFVSSTSALLDAIGPELLPRAYGGSAEEVLAPAAVQRLRAAREQRRAQRAGSSEGGTRAEPNGVGLAVAGPHGRQPRSEDEFVDVCEDLQESALEK